MKFHTAPQYAVEHMARKRRRIFAIDLRQQDVRGHHQLHARRDCRGKGNQFRRLQALHRSGEDWQVQMGVHDRVAMAREMFGAGEHASCAQPAIEGRAHSGDKMRIGAKAAILG